MVKLFIWTARLKYQQVCLNNFILLYHKLRKKLRYFLVGLFSFKEVEDLLLF